MSAELHLTERDRLLLQALVLKVRLFSQRQIVEHWFGDLSNTRRRLKRLAHAQWIQRIVVLARPTPELELPLFSWRPGHAAPDCGQVAWQCQQRWRRRPARQCVAWIATEQASQRFGGTARGSLRHPTQATHDLGVAQVWLRFLRANPALAAAWHGEDLLASTRRGEKLPDAFILGDQNTVTWVIEFGGDYDAGRVNTFHQDCAARQLPYQLW